MKGRGERGQRDGGEEKGEEVRGAGWEDIQSKLFTPKRIQLSLDCTGTHFELFNLDQTIPTSSKNDRCEMKSERRVGNRRKEEKKT